MRPIRYTISRATLFLLFQAAFLSYGQLGISFDLKKPKEYDERVLRSEKSDQKKFTLPTRFIQNTVTHYNYFFNANNKLNEIIDRAKSVFKDDYSKLLPFYNYSLNVTSADKIQLDSVVYKAETGIALHDLRGDWIDNLYLLWGASYYLHKEFDSAAMMFQFINYAFAPKEKDGYYKTIGSSMDGNQAFSIATKEKANILKEAFSKPPSRNDAFIWQIRNYLAQDKFPEAASLIVTLKSDPNFPKRLHNDLEEVQAWWFYKQNMWDSAASHLVNALSNATTKQERARWEYLTAQLYELSGQNDEAEKYYSKSIIHTTDPVLDIYARLNSIRVNKTGGENYIDKNIADLLKMAKREKYDEYRDVIYYMAAQMRLQQNNVDAAYDLLQKGARYSSNSIEQRNKIFLQLGEMAYAKKLYRPAFNFYDSLNLNDTSLHDVAEISKRKEILGALAGNIEIIERQDSLQKIAAMPEDQRKTFVKKLARQLRKNQGLKDEGISSSIQPFGMQDNNTPFFSISADTKGDWYFYNTSLRDKGYADFISRWGKRPNVDNWRRSSVITGNISNLTQTGISKDSSSLKSFPGNSAPTEITFDALYDKLPLTDEKLNASNDSISNALFNLGKIYAEDLEDCAATIETFEALRNRFAGFAKMDEVLFHLYYCYNKNGEMAKAEAVKKMMSSRYPKSNYTTIAVTGKNPESKTANPEATKAYEKIYDQFIEGNFADAVEQKKIADSLYGKNFWTPQLLYIESVYYIKQRQDSIAKNILNSIVTQFPKTALADRATTLIDVLGRRKQIEEELTNLVIEKTKKEETQSKPVTIVQTPVNKINPADTINKNQKPVIIQQTETKPIIDTTSKIIAKSPSATYSFTPDAPHYVVLILTKVDPVFVNEAKNAFFRYNRETYYNKKMATDIIDIDGSNRLLLISPFKDSQEAIEYIDHARPVTSTEIIPWLKGGKYSFSILTDANLEILKTTKDIDNYKNFLNKNFPGKF